MKKIKFYELSFSRNPVMGAIMLCVCIFPVLSLFDVFNFLGEQNVKLITAACYLMIAYHVGFRQLFYRNHVQWNKRGINIKVNGFWAKSISFSKIKEVVYDEDAYTIVTHFGNSRKVINLEGIDAKSKSRLQGILREHVR